MEEYNILIVDDRPDNLHVLRQLLSQQHYKVRPVTSGEMALQTVSTWSPDLILLDIMMPGMDGFETCKKLKSDKRKCHIPVIFLSAKAETKDIVKGFQVGGVDYVSKPFIAEELLARVKTHIQIKTLKSLLPICSKCKKIRDDQGLWHQVETYIENHTETDFSHGICDECQEKLYGGQEWYIKKKAKEK